MGGVLVLADQILRLMGLLNLGAGVALDFWNRVKASTPDLPDRTDAEVIAIMKGEFAANRQDAEAKKDALGS